MADFDDVKTLLDSDLQHFEHELDELYSRMSRYETTANVLDSQNRPSDAEYFRDLAVDTYESFEMAIQLKKDAEDYKF